ncbi:hypothetical protein [Planotetraspora silvatica]|nr:hypothetical protein [Planotetraspora silvatica]
MKDEPRHGTRRGGARSVGAGEPGGVSGRGRDEVARYGGGIIANEEDDL